jgi:hypothetical protein
MVAISDNVNSANCVVGADPGQGAVLTAGNVKTIPFSLAGLGNTQAIDCSAYTWVSLQTTGVAGSPILNYEVSNDGSTWIALPLLQATVTGGTVPVTTVAATSIWQGPILAKFFRLRNSGVAATWIAGVVVFRAAPLPQQQVQATVQGAGAAGAALAGAPVNIGGLAKTANPTAVADAQKVNTLHDKLGKLIAVSAIRDLKGTQTTTITASTAETTIVTAIAATFCDIYRLVIANTSATATTVSIRDTTAGSVKYTFQIPAGDTRGFSTDAGSAWAQTTVNTNWTAQSSASITSLIISVDYVKNI